MPTRLTPSTPPVGATRTRLDGLAAGSFGLAVAFLGGMMVVQLTGAPPVVLVLAALFVTWVAAALGAWRTTRGVRVAAVDLPATSTVGEEFPLRVTLTGVARPVWVEVRRPGGGDASLVAAGWAGRDGEARLDGAFGGRGVVAELGVTVRSAGSLGLVWFKRRAIWTIPPHRVAPRAVPGPVRIESSPATVEGERAGRAGAVAGDTDGVRPWRDGDSERSVHWASSYRTGQLVVHDRRQPVDRRTVVRAESGTPDPDAAAGAALHELGSALRRGEEAWAAVGDGPPEPIADAEAARAWAAGADLGGGPHAGQRRVRPLFGWLRRRVEPEITARRSARLWGGAATLVAIVLLSTSLEYSLPVTLAAAAGVLAGALATARLVETGDLPRGWIRAAVAAGATGALAAVVAATGRVGGLLDVLRGPLPQLLMVLIALHGFECRDRRTIRVSVAISAVVLMYAAGFRIDATLAWWLVVWAVCAAQAARHLALPTERAVSDTDRSRRGVRGRRGAERSVSDTARSPLRPAGAVLLAAAATFGVLLVVPIPPGPARLTLPTLIREERPVDEPGAIAGADGSIKTAADTGDGTRSNSPQAGDYTGFAETLDTNVRGALSDTVVMRVRAGAPDFWRGQTFAEFDGRLWRADDDKGSFVEGPEIFVRPQFGDTQAYSPNGRFRVRPEQFVQTFFVETDMSNVVFAAYRPERVVLDGALWARPDGGLRATTAFPDGSVYTVVSQRRPVTEELLRRVGDVAERLTPQGRAAFAEYLAVPESTSPETIALAEQLAAGLDTTYDVVRAYEAWIAANVEYDLHAPLPAGDDDAVTDLLFGGKRGFCEQIASALVVMLRSQGVPARLATGYLPGARDRVAGVWEVRASDAHAWAEVWFPELGWQAFDPTAQVPLAGDSAISSIGADLLKGIGEWVGAYTVWAVAIVAGPVLAYLAWRGLRELRRRGERGRWGLLQDEFTARAVKAGAAPGASNPERAAAFGTEPAARLAEQLDAAAFAPDWRDDDGSYREARELVGQLREEVSRLGTHG